MARPKAKLRSRSWRVFEFAKKARPIAKVEALDAESAIRKVIELHGITDPHRQRRLVAQPID
jgi:hypothetical protein